MKRSENSAWKPIARYNEWMFGRKPEKPETREGFRLAADLSDLRASGGYLLYLSRIWQRGKLYLFARHTGHILSPLLWFMRIWNTVFFLLSLIGTGAFLLGTSLIILAVFPFALVLFLAFYYGQRAEDRRAASYLLRNCDTNKILYIFTDRSPECELLPPDCDCFPVYVRAKSGKKAKNSLLFHGMEWGGHGVAIRESLYFLLKQTAEGVGEIH